MNCKIGEAKSNYERIGNHIVLVDERNKGLQVKQLLGLSISKQFIPSVANIIGTDMENYKIIRKNQFACSTMQVRRDKKMPVALLKEVDEAIISQAYPIFEVKDPKELLPEYLMMWFTRSEFDREACFHAVGGVRGSLEWEDFENLQLPIPSIDKQREIVKEYNVIQNRIALNQQLIQKLEETAQAIYREWFVDFEFPDGNGKPYKSNGGEMVWCEELGKEIPLGWEVTPLGSCCSKITKGTTPENMYTDKTESAFIKYIKGESLKENHLFDIEKISFIDSQTNNELNRSKLEEFDICYSIAGTLDKFAIVDKEILPANTNQAIAIIRVNESKINRFYIIGLFLSNWQMEFYRFNIQQAVQANLSLETIAALPIIIPDLKTLNSISRCVESIFNNKLNKDIENRKLENLRSLLLSKLATIEN
jgi:type I restriction enzyme S subunit